MFDITIHITTAQPRPRTGIRLTHQEFTRGFKSGVGEGAAGELAGIPFTDEELVSSLKELFEDPDTSDASLYFAIGSLIGSLTARW